jgi:F-type H+-transporting ATPase subunit b
MNINATLFVEVVIFAGFVVLTMRYVWPPLAKILDERKVLIDQGIRNAEQAERTLQDAHKNAEQVVLIAKEKAKGIVSQARKEASQIVVEGKEKIQMLRFQTEKDLQAEIKQMTNNARKTIHQDVTRLSMALCQKILTENSMDKKMQEQVLASYNSEEAN